MTEPTTTGRPRRTKREAEPEADAQVAAIGEAMRDALDGKTSVLNADPPRIAKAFPMNVAEALSYVIRDLPGIGKDERMTQGASYNYRGIEQITGHAAVLFARHGVVVTPRVLSYDIVEAGKTKQDNLILEARLLIEYTFHHGASNTSIVASTLGVGRDSSDKCANKAMTAAFKYALMQTLMVADKKDEQDAERIEVGGSQAASTPPPGPPPPQEDPAVEALRARAVELCKQIKQVNGNEGAYTVALREEAARATGGKGVPTWCHDFPQEAFDFATIQSDLMAGAQQGSLDDVPPPADADR